MISSICASSLRRKIALGAQADTQHPVLDHPSWHSGGEPDRHPARICAGVRRPLPKRCPEWRLFVITGLAEGLPPFSTFSPDTTTLIQQGRRWRAGAAIAGYVAGSLAVTSPRLASCAALKPI